MERVRLRLSNALREANTVVKDKPTASQWFNEMNAIARGVARRLESLTGFSAMVTLETVAIARQLRIPEGQIKRWAISQSNAELSTGGSNQSHPTPLKEGEIEQWSYRGNTVVKPRSCQPLKLS